MRFLGGKAPVVVFEHVFAPPATGENDPGSLWVKAFPSNSVVQVFRTGVIFSNAFSTRRSPAAISASCFARQGNAAHAANAGTHTATLWATLQCLRETRWDTDPNA